MTVAETSQTAARRQDTAAGMGAYPGNIRFLKGIISDQMSFNLPGYGNYWDRIHISGSNSGNRIGKINC